MKTAMQNILAKTFTFAPIDTKTHVAIPFYIDREYTALHVCCSYSPKTVEDMVLAEDLGREAIRKYFFPSLQADRAEKAPALFAYATKETLDWRKFLPIYNLITLSIDYEQEYAGCAHRHDPRQHHVISADFASPGFDRRRVLPGRWRVVLSLHAICVPVDYELFIEAGDKVECSL